MMLKHKAVEKAEQSKDNCKRKLRKKIIDIFKDVAKRQNLQQQQEKARKFRERRFRRGEGPLPDIGDHSSCALGLTAILGGGAAEGHDLISPRRTCLLQCLGMDELDMLRKDPRYFLVALQGEESSCNDDLLDFFTPAREEKNGGVEEYVRKLLLKNMPPKPENIDRLADASASAKASGREVTRLHYNEPLEMMPCMGRQPGIRDDMESPTLRKVRLVCRKRDAEDKEIIDERREAMARRVALNDFKAKQQQREVQLKAMKEKEMHKVRMLAAEERVLMSSAFEDQRIARERAKHDETIARGCLQAAVATEQRRKAAEEGLQAWHTNSLLGAERIRKMDQAKLIKTENNWNAYVGKLWKIGFEKHSEIMTQARENDALKSKVQHSISDQLAIERQREADALRQHTDEKQAAAAYRRERGLQSRYNFVEQAFGPQATAFDWKHHAGNEIDRRSATWRKNAASWDKLKASFSEPALHQTI
jgi:hypothetical protein